MTTLGAVLACALALTAVGAVAGSAWHNRTLLRHVQEEQRAAYQSAENIDARHRGEREMLVRAVLARNTPEFAQLERVAHATPNADGRRMTPGEYREMLAKDMAGMGLDSADLPGVPEGL